ncbi:unnamed protein product [Zymoseptoria tritici ST99CH_1A5]|uniref:Uncharacterized protein n=2 Tax=Zymoseptoria tritici TaxID=1047171 RepID=A0A2H1H926_ZYMTR|nr:unnamed protein product [Zymoseptoria tritici ST99CH_1E4]SMY30181.1 unnamed protein product [Zymoseptoria tritici ST99CH_1A5]
MNPDTPPVESYHHVQYVNPVHIWSLPQTPLLPQSLSLPRLQPRPQVLIDQTVKMGEGSSNSPHRLDDMLALPHSRNAQPSTTDVKATPASVPPSPAFDFSFSLCPFSVPSRPQPDFDWEAVSIVHGPPSSTQEASVSSTDGDTAPASAQHAFTNRGTATSTSLYPPQELSKPMESGCMGRGTASRKRKRD